MKNRIIENWLTNSSEIGYQVAFCQMLISQGYTLLHKTRHGPLEQGKDVLALDKNGVPCAFQLKQGNITLGVWRDIRGEIEELVELRMIHPSIMTDSVHLSYLVTNGELSEEVRREIDDRNREWKKKGLEPLHVIVKGQLLKNFQTIYGDFFPVDIKDVSKFLRLYQEEGTSPLNKLEFAEILESILLHTSNSKKNKPSKAHISQTISGAVVIASYLLSTRIQSNNHVGVIEGLTMLLAYIFCVLEKHSLNTSMAKQSIDLIFQAIDEQCKLLIEELRTRSFYIEGNPLSDVYTYKPRMTVLTGYLSACGLMKFLQGDSDRDTFIGEFLKSHTPSLCFYCEAMSPMLINNVLYKKVLGDEDGSRGLLVTLIVQILQENIPFKGMGMPDPYHQIDDALMWLIGNIDPSIEDEQFLGASYSLKPIIYMHARRGLKEVIAKLWIKISNIQFAEYIPSEKWKYFIWRNEDSGEFRTRFPKVQQSWKELTEGASSDYLPQLPKTFELYPKFIPLFLNVYPHRLTSEVLMFVESCLDKKMSEND